jgi:hypothetical protein
VCAICFEAGDATRWSIGEGRAQQKRAGLFSLRGSLVAPELRCITAMLASRARMQGLGRHSLSLCSQQ